MSEHRTYPGLEAVGETAQERGADTRREPLLTCIQALLTALAVILLLASLSAHAESYTFRAYQRADGLENPNIHCLVQDHRGFLWVCTEGGLFRFDGNRMDRVDTFEGRDVPYITAALEDSANRFWASSYHELLYLDDAGLHRPHLPRFGTDKTTGTALASFAGDRDRIFVLADQVLYRVYTQDGGLSWKQSPVLTQKNLAKHPELSTLESLSAINGSRGEAGSRTLWLACGKKLCEVSPEDGKVQVWGEEQGVPADDWRMVMRDHSGRLWARGVRRLISLPRGTAHFVTAEGSLTTKALNMRLPSVAEDPAGHILINVSDGIARLEGDDWHVYGTQNGLPPHLTANLMFDRQGSFWFSTDGHGLRRWLGYDNWESWTVRDGLTVGSLWGVDEDRKGTMWVAAELDVDSLQSIKSRWRPLSIPQPMRQAQALLVDTRGHVWIGQATGDALDYDPASGTMRRVAHVDGIYNFFQDPSGGIWICGTKALYRLDAADGYTKLQTGLNGIPFLSGGIYEGKSGPKDVLYFNGDRGLFRFDPHGSAGFEHIQMPEGAQLPFNSPLAVAKDGTLWMEGEASPIIHLRVRGTKAELIERVEIPTVASRSVVQISLDRRGWLWVGTDRGMDVYDGHTWVNLSSDDGLVWDDTDSDSFHESPDGSIWIGTSGGMSHIRRPEEIFREDRLVLHVDDARVGSTPIQVGQGTKIPWKNRGTVALSLGISNPARASAMRFRYRLEGMENEWQETTDRQIHYSALPPGRYRLALIAMDVRRHQQSEPVYLEFRLMPPWWRTTWFLWGLAVTLACLAGLISWWRVSSLIARQQKLEELVRERTHQLEMEKKELIEARIALVEQASRDGLTGLLNRSAIFDVLTTEIVYANEKNTPLAIVLADLDHFKRINDTYGHQVGDAVLRECARRFSHATRPTDYVGRYGGEELLLVMPGLSQENSAERLENLRATIAHEMFDCDGIGLPVTCSFGVAWLDEQSRSIKPLISLADQALYIAKTRGRNRVETMATAASGLFFPDGSGPLLTTSSH